MHREVICPGIYKDFRNKLYATMGITETISNENFFELLKRPNIVSFDSQYTEQKYTRITIIRHKGKLYTIEKNPLIIYKTLFDGDLPLSKPLDKFNEKIDKLKYPTVKQEYKFELIRY